MFQFLGTLLLIWFGWWLFKILRGALRITRPIRQARKAYRQAEREAERKAERERPEREAEQRRAVARAAMRSYAEDVEYTETVETPKGEEKIHVREYTECQVTDVEWEEI